MEDMQATRLPLIGDKAPAFKAKTTQGDISFPEGLQGLVVIPSPTPTIFPGLHLGVFVLRFHGREFKALNTELIGLSVDSLYAHIAWLRKIQELEWNGKKNIEVKFPLIEDIRMEVANKYGMMQPGQSSTQAVRAVFVIDPEAKIRTILYYPLTTGRNFDEIKRMSCLEKADSDGVATPRLAARRRRDRAHRRFLRHRQGAHAEPK